MKRRDEVLALLPATMPELARKTGMTNKNLSRVLADAMAEHAIHRTGRRRLYVYHAGPAPSRAVSSVFDLGARL